MVSPDNYIRKVLIANGIGDIVVGLMLILASNQLADWLGLFSSIDLNYLAGGWGVAAVSFGLLRFFAGLRQSAELQWFVATFGLFEGIVLTCVGLFFATATKLTFFQVSPSTIFALVFAVAYGFGFYLRATSILYKKK
jgi:hypothetical protein